MSDVTDADRAKAAELWRAARYADPADPPEVEDVIAAALAAERAAAVADLHTRVEAVAEGFERMGRGGGGVEGAVYRDAAARLRAATGTTGDPA